MRCGKILTPLLLGLALVLHCACKPVHLRMHLKQGNERYNAQKYEEAIAHYDEILAADPEHWQANYMRAVSYMALYHPGSTHEKDLEYSSKAIDAFEKCLALPAAAEETEKVRNYYIGLLIAADRGSKALEVMEALLGPEPQNAKLMAQIARLQAKQGNFDQAMRFYEMWAAAEPQNKEAWYTIGVLCWDRSYRGAAGLSVETQARIVEQGLEALDKTLELDPRSGDALTYINLLYREKHKLLRMQGRTEEAREAQARAEDFYKQALAARKEKKSGGA